jgi:hypothetical protein
MLSGLDFPGSANLPIGDSQNAIQENGAPRKGQTAPHSEVGVMSVEFTRVDHGAIAKMGGI